MFDDKGIFLILYKVFFIFIGCGCLIFIVIAICCIIASCQSGSNSGSGSNSSYSDYENESARDRHIKNWHEDIKYEIDRKDWIYVSPWTGKLVCPYCEDPGLHKRDKY